MPDRTIITLSSIPSRFSELGPTLTSLVEQDHPAEEVQLWIPKAYRRFPDWDGSLPEVPAGITIMRSDTDLGPATKVLPALQRAAGQNAVVIFCDDDRVYRRNWLSTMLAVMDERPGCCVATHGRQIPGEYGRPARRGDRMPRANMSAASPLLQGWHEFTRLLHHRPFRRMSGYADLLFGYCGVAVRPEFFPPEVFDIPSVLWTHDDVWLSGHLERRGIPIWVDARIPTPIERREVMAIDALVDATIEGHDRHGVDRASIAYFRETYGLWPATPFERVLAPIRPMARRLVERAA